ncbi:MAG: polyphenol oxidase family protein [Patescibacteria group bacterium]
MALEGESGDRLQAAVERYRNLSTLNAVPGIRYGFSDRSFRNMSLVWNKDWPDEDAQKNINAFAEAAGFDPKQLRTMLPMHGRDIVVLPEDDRDGELPNAAIFITKKPGVVLGLKPADCAPVILSNKNGEFVAMVHAGSKGLEIGVIDAAVNRLRKMGYDPLEIVAGIGPMAGCYERGHIDTDKPEDWLPYVEVPGEPDGVVVDGHNDKFRIHPKREGDVMWVQLNSVCRARLEQAGLEAKHISDSGFCTVCEAEQGKTFSHSVAKRDHKPVGRFLAYVEKKI